MPWRSLLLALPFVAAALPALAQRTAEEELNSLVAPPGFEVELFAAEPLVVNPAAIDIDTHGRVWVAEIQWYRAAAKQPPADQIKVLEDTDGDGKADKVTVFAEGVFAPMSICVAGSKVYVATSPDLWVYEDNNGDLVADGPPTKLLTGFGGFNHDHGAHSLVLGPDHKWWMSHGDTGFDVTGVDGSHIAFRWGAMLRGELDGTKLEQIAVNFRNPYEISVNSFGESFVSDNDNDGNFSVRICWILEGGNYGWFGGPPFAKDQLDLLVPPGTPYREHWHFRGYLPGYVPATLVTGFGSPCGMCFYEGDAFGQDYSGAPIHADAGPREVRIYRHRNAGYGMTAGSENVLTTAGDNYFRPDDVCTAPDGTLYVSDWYDGGVGGHAYNDPDRGRIFRLKPKGEVPQRVGGPGPYDSVAAAIAGLQNPNLATQFLAREKLLAEGEAAVPALTALLDSAAAKHRARALWVLDRIGGGARDAVLRELSSDDPALRALAVRILRRHGEEYASVLLPLADDENGEVAREVTLALRTLSGEEALATLVRLAARYDGTDRYQLEALHIAAGERKQELYDRLHREGQWTLAQLPLMQLLNPDAAAEYLTAQLASSGSDPEAGRILLEAAGNIASAEAGRTLLAVAANGSAAADLRKLALARLSANLSGAWKDLAGDEALLAAFRELLPDDALGADVLAAVERHQLHALGGDVLRLAGDSSAHGGLRAAAIATAAKLRSEDLTPRFTEMLDGLLRDDDERVRTAALDALVDGRDARALRGLLAGDGVADALRERAVDRLMLDAGGAITVLRLMDDGSVAPRLAARAVAAAAIHPDSNVRVLYERYIPAGERPQTLGSAISADEILALGGDPARGERIFFQSSSAQCKNCHKVQSVGGTLGPDLSQIGKKYEIRTLLETILDPSKAIAPEYVPHLLETDGGQIFAGFLLEKTDQQVVLRDAKDTLIRVAAEEIVTLEPQRKSLMPDLVLRDVTAQDAADLLAYLASLQSAVAHADRLRVLGPFNSGGDGLSRDYGPEGALDRVDLAAEYAGLDGQKNRWELIVAADGGGYPAFDQVRYCQSRGLRTDRVTHYFLVYADSPADQEATLLVGSDDGCRVWVNGEAIHEQRATRALGYAQDRVPARLRNGRNTIVVKVENTGGPGGVALSVAAPSGVQLTTN